MKSRCFPVVSLRARIGEPFFYNSTTMPYQSLYLVPSSPVPSDFV
jgi:hypothetical protein